MPLSSDFSCQFCLKTCFDATIFGCFGIIVVPLRFLETSIFGFCGLIFFQGIFVNAVIFCFFAVNFADAIFFHATIFGSFCVNFVQGNLLDSFRGFLGFYFARRYFTDATIFGFFGVSFAEGIRFHAAAFRSSSDNFVQNIKHLCYHLRFLALTLPCSNFWCHYLREIWSSVDICETAIFEFCGVHFVQGSFVGATIFGFFGVNFVQGRSFLMPLSSEKLVSFFVQGAFCDATIFGFLVLNVSMNRFFWCHYLRILCSFCSRHFFMPLLSFFSVIILSKAVFLIPPYTSIFGFFGVNLHNTFFWCHYLRSLWC